LKQLLTLSLLLAALAFGARFNRPATCTGSKNCRACKTCNYCGHCAKKGGTCGVCKPRGAGHSEHGGEDLPEPETIVLPG
jgi:hypothetical protein